MEKALSIRVVQLLLLSSLALPAVATAQTYVVIDAGATLYRAPDRKSTKLVLGGDHYLTLRELKRQKGWVAVEVNGEIAWEDHCAVQPRGLSGLQLKMWVREKSLALVTTKSTVSRFKDGTSIRLAAGVPLRKQSSGEYEAHVAGRAWPAVLEERAVGDSFRSDGLPDEEGTYRETATAFVVDGRPIDRTNGKWFEHIREVEIDGKTRHEFELRCATAVVATKLTPEDPDGGGGLIGALIGSAFDDQHRVKKGATAYWPDGDVAGLARDATSLAEAKEAGGRFCATLAAEAQSGGVVLCFDADDVTEERGLGLGVGLGLKGLKSKPTPTPTAISERVVERIALHKAPKIEKCYVAARKKRNVRGSIVVDFWVAPSGEVTQTKIGGGTIDRQDLRACTSKVVESMIFPADPERETTRVSHRFVFPPPP